MTPEIQDDRASLLDVARRMLFSVHRAEREVGINLAEDRPIVERCDQILRASRGGVVAPGTYAFIWNVRQILLRPRVKIGLRKNPIFKTSKRRSTMPKIIPDSGDGGKARPITPMPAERSSDRYHSSTRIRDVGGSTEANPNPKAPFVNPNPGGLLGPDWEKASK